MLAQLCMPCGCDAVSIARRPPAVRLAAAHSCADFAPRAQRIRDLRARHSEKLARLSLLLVTSTAGMLITAGALLAVMVGGPGLDRHDERPARILGLWGVLYFSFTLTSLAQISSF